MNHEIKVTTNKATGHKTFYVDGKKKPAEYVRFLECLATRMECMITRSNSNYRYDYKTLRG